MKTTRDCADIIFENKEAIISKWEDEVRQRVTGAGMSSSLALRNQLSDLLHDIGEIFQESEQADFEHQPDVHLRTVEKNRHHGKLRAETENYTIDQVIQEYFILQRIIRNTLYSEGTLNDKGMMLLNTIFESTILNASSAFSHSIQEVQDKMVGTLAHDIRNPLTTALSAIEMLAQHSNGNEQLIRLARKSLDRSISLTEGLLDTISLKSGQGMMMHFTRGDYAQVVKDVCEEASVSYQRTVKCDVPEGPVEGNFDPLSVRRLLDNLLSNAVKHGKPNTEIVISLQDLDKEVQLSVINFGHPISSEKQESIFNFLKHDDTADERKGEKSWGMGLTLVKLIADAHAGSISLKSDGKSGTQFIVKLAKKVQHTGKVRMKLS